MKTPRSTQPRKEEQQAVLEKWIKNLPKATEQEKIDWNQEVFKMLSQQDKEVLQKQADVILKSDKIAKMQEALPRIATLQQQDFLRAVTLNTKLGLVYRTLMTLLYVSGLLYPQQDVAQTKKLEDGERDLMQNFQLRALGDSYSISLFGNPNVSFPVSEDFLKLSAKLPELITDQAALDPLNKALSPQIAEVVSQDGKTTITTITGITTKDIGKTTAIDSIFDEFDGRTFTATVTDNGDRIRVSVAADDGSFVENLHFLDLSGVDVGNVLDLFDGVSPAVLFQPLGAGGEIVMDIDFSLLPSGDGSAKIEFDRTQGLMRLTELITQVIESATITATPSNTATASKTATASITQSASITPAATSNLPSKSASTTITASATGAATVSVSPSASKSLLALITQSMIASQTNSPTTSASPTNSVSPTTSESASVSVSMSATGTPSVTVTISSTPTTSFSISLSPSESVAFLASLSNTPSSSLPVSFTPSLTTTGTPTFSITPSPTPTPSKSAEVTTSPDGSKSVSFSLSPTVSSSLTQSVSPAVSQILKSTSPNPTRAENVVGGDNASLSLGFLALLLTIPCALGAYCAHKKRNKEDTTNTAEVEMSRVEVPGLDFHNVARVPQVPNSSTARQTASSSIARAIFADPDDPRQP